MKKFTRDPRRHGLATLYKFAALLVPEGFWVFAAKPTLRVVNGRMYTKYDR